jgi:hypothetical protein
MSSPYNSDSITQLTSCHSDALGNAEGADAVHQGDAGLDFGSLVVNRRATLTPTTYFSSSRVIFPQHSQGRSTADRQDWDVRESTGRQKSGAWSKH